MEQRPKAELTARELEVAVLTAHLQVHSYDLQCCSMAQSHTVYLSSFENTLHLQKSLPSAAYPAISFRIKQCRSRAQSLFQTLNNIAICGSNPYKHHFLMDHGEGLHWDSLVSVGLTEGINCFCKVLYSITSKVSAGQQIIWDFPPALQYTRQEICMLVCA